MKVAERSASSLTVTSSTTSEPEFQRYLVLFCLEQDRQGPVRSIQPRDVPCTDCGGQNTSHNNGVVPLGRETPVQWSRAVAAAGRPSFHCKDIKKNVVTVDSWVKFLAAT